MDPQDDLKVPPLTPALLDYLDRLFPDQSPRLNDTDREVWYKAGQASVVRKLRTDYEALKAKEME